MIPYRAPEREAKALSPIREGNSTQEVVNLNITFEIPTDTFGMQGRRVPNEEEHFPKELRINKERARTATDR